MATGGQQYDTNRLNAKIKTLLGRELKPILRDLDLPVSGSKAAMQDRLLLSLFTSPASHIIYHAVSMRRNFERTYANTHTVLQEYKRLLTLATLSATIGSRS
jgi:hypothetical protein